MTPDLLTLIQAFQTIPFVKYGILAIIGLYVVFAFVIFNQVRVMNKVIDTPPLSTIIVVIAFLHLLAASSLLLFSIAIL